MLVQNTNSYPRHLPSYQNTNTPHHSDTSFWDQPQSSLQQIQSYDSIDSFGNDQSPSVFDFPTQNLRIQVQPELMQSEQQQQQSNSWLSNGQLTPTSATPRAYHNRESSLSSLGSAGPASPYNPTTSNPHVALSTDPVDVYYELHDQSQYHAKPLTPAHTPSQEHFLAHQYSRLNSQNFNTNFSHHDFSHLNMSNEGLPRQQTMGDSELMPAPEFTNSGRPSVASVASHESPSTPPTLGEERRKTAEFRSTMPKLDRTITDIYQDELYNPSFQITSAPPSRPLQTITALSSAAQNDIFTQRLQAANNQHLNSRTPLNIPSRERSPFRQGSPLAPSTNSFGSQRLPNIRLGTASGMREQQKAENDAMALQQQLDRTSPGQSTPNTISPKDVDLVYHENEEDASIPLFPKQELQSPQQYRPRTQTQMKRERDVDDGSSQQSFGSMAISRRESSSNYSISSQATPQASAFNFAQPAVPQNMRQLPQQYPFISQSQRQPSSVSSATDDFPATLTSMDSSSSEYAPEAGAGEIKKPARTSADSGTYTCTYHNCTLRFDTPAKLQRHKREGHRQSANVVGGDDAEALRNTQAGPHKCERINPSTGKPCNTIFSRPYDLTRHEDTIHNARKKKIRCNLCTEEKTFSRADALTRHYKVVHPEQILPTKSRRRGGAD